MSYREWLVRVQPPWLQGDAGRRWAEVLGAVLDESASLTATGVLARFAARAPEDALATLGAERTLTRYPGESGDAFRARVLGAWEFWQWSGTEYGLGLALSQLGYNSAIVPVRNYDNTRWSEIDVYLYAGTRSYDGSQEERNRILAVINQIKPAHARLASLQYVPAGPLTWDPAGLTWDPPGQVWGAPPIQLWPEQAYYPNPIGLRTFYVAPTGSNSNPGTQSQPWATINYAISQLVAGDVLRVMDGVYNEYVHINRSGTPTNRIVVMSHNKHGAKINATGNNYGITIGGSYVDVIGFEVYGASRVGIMSWTYNPANVYQNNRVMWCYVHDIVPPCDSDGGAGIVLSAYSENCEASYNVVRDIGDYSAGPCNWIHGIYAQGYGALVRGNLVHRVRGYGLDNWHRPKDGRIINNTVVNCRYGGLSLGTDIPGFTVDGYIVANNIFALNGSYGVQEVAQTGVNQFINNLVWNNPTNWALASSTHQNSINADPRFVDYQASGNGNYRLLQSSPAINAGALLSQLPDYDLDGLPRLRGAPDIGAYELQEV
jgi:hypothetical protein